MPKEGDGQSPGDDLSLAAALLFEQALAMHSQGKLQDAERIYGDVLQRQPNHFGALLRLAAIAVQTKRPERGAQLIRRAIELDAKVAVAHNVLGRAFEDLERPEDALASYDNAIRLKPDFAVAYNNRGGALLQLKRPADALASYDKAIALKPDYTIAHYRRGNTFLELNRPEDALASYDTAIALMPDFAAAYNNRGNALLELKRPRHALASYDKAILLKPDYAIAYYHRGNAFLALRRLEDAVANYDKAITLSPDFAAAYNNRGSALLELNRPKHALASYDKAIARKPDWAEIYNNRGKALLNLMRPNDALASYDMAIALKPDYAEAYSNRGLALQDLKRPADALASYDKAIALKPDFAEAHWSQSLCLLQMGSFEQGWRQYEWRKRRNNPIAARSFLQPLWLGEENIAGNSLFIWWEQGFGDTIQFCRYAKLAEARGAKVIMSVDQPLRGLLRQLSPTIEIMNSDEIPGDFDFHCPMLSLPLAFWSTHQTIPVERQYLKPDAALRVSWSARLPPGVKPRIGVAWSGRPTHKNDHNRSIELKQFRQLFDPGAHWICLQKEIRESDIGEKIGGITYFGDDLRDFSDTAALLELMDLVITVDTSVAHLAGAMGKAVWILLPYNADWRWLMDRDDSPWYPTARLFRQQQTGDWAGVIDRVKNELCSLIGCGRIGDTEVR